jgi:predicted membrane chloride channel (bestrophin family)
MEPLTITSFALSLLLVFRTNSSYDRFVEARKLWGTLANRSCDMMRQVHFSHTTQWRPGCLVVHIAVQAAACVGYAQATVHACMWWCALSGIQCS